MMRQKKAKKQKKNKEISFAERIGTGKERDYFLENVSMLLSSGMDLSSAINSVRKEIRTGGMKKLLDRLSADINEGVPLWKALSTTGFFKDHVISLVRIGEETGNLSRNLRVIALQEQKNRIFKSKIRSAMMYPLFVLSLTVVIGVGIAWFILPRLADIFSSLDVDLPALTKILIDLGTFLGEHGLIVIPLFLLFVASVLFFVFFYKKTKFIGQTILFHLPGVGNLVKQVEIARFGFLLGTLLDAGLPVMRALDSLYDATLFEKYKKLYKHIRSGIEEGNSFQKSFASFPKSNKYIPQPIQQMIFSAEQSGNLSKSLLSIGGIFEGKIETTTKNLTVILEPILLVIVWAGVVSVALAVILPIYSLIGGFNATPELEEAPPEVEVLPEDVPVEEEEEVVVEEESIPTELRILTTGVGYLNVRSEPSFDGERVAEVLPGEVYEYIDEEDGWYEIVISDEEEGWVLGEFVELIEE